MRYTNKIFGCLITLFIVCVLFCSCNSSKQAPEHTTDQTTLANQSEETTISIEKPTEKQTERPTELLTEKTTELLTEKPTEIETVAKIREYTAVELASKNLNEIKEIMGDDYNSAMAQLTQAFSSSGCPYVYNYDVLPGFAFAIDDNDYYGISIMDGAKLNDSISSDMTYNQVASVIGDMEGYFAGQEIGPMCSADVDGYSVTFCFADNDFFHEISRGQISSDLMRECNPQIDSIGLRKSR